MDEIDREIINLLRKNARISIKEISREINLSQPSVSIRLKRLEKNNSIEGYFTSIDPKILNKNIVCVCFLSSKNDISESDFFDYVDSNPDIDECHYITGDGEFFMKISTESSLKLGELLDYLRKKYGFKTKTSQVVKSIKGNFTKVF